MYINKELFYALKDTLMIEFLKDDIDTVKLNLLKDDKKLLKAYKKILKYYGVDYGK